MSFSLDSEVVGERTVTYLIGYKIELHSDLTFDKIEEISWWSYDDGSGYLWRYGLLPSEGMVKR